MAQVMVHNEHTLSRVLLDAGNTIDVAHTHASNDEQELEKFPLRPQSMAKYQENDKQCNEYQTDKHVSECAKLKVWKFLPPQREN